MEPRIRRRLNDLQGLMVTSVSCIHAPLSLDVKFITIFLFPESSNRQNLSSNAAAEAASLGRGRVRAAMQNLQPPADKPTPVRNVPKPNKPPRTNSTSARRPLSGAASKITPTDSRVSRNDDVAGRGGRVQGLISRFQQPN